MAHHGWTRKYRLEFERSFFDFLGEARVLSKDEGEIVLGDHLYRAQKGFFTDVFDGLEQDIHVFDALKSRQLGISTSTRALSVFWQGMHDGLPGACVFDTDLNKQNARREIETMIRMLPASLGFPHIKANNRNSITLENDSVITFLAAGVKKTKSSGGLGRSLGIAMYHASELCSYDNSEGWEAFENSKSDLHPNRLYIRESTGRGFNSWNEMWEEDRKDPNVRCTFIGWWAKDSQIIAREDPQFERYGLQPPTDKEAEKIREVRERYGWQITPEQLAWVRRKTDPTAEAQGDAEADYTPNVIRLQEQPWVEDDAFQMTGAVFFHPEKLAEQANHNVSKDFKTYMFSAGIEFTDMRVYKPPNARSIELKVWEEPQDDCVYVVSADPAFGSHEDNDRSAVQVLRCYADGCDQVAEYAWPLVSTRQFAWVILSLAAWYATPVNSEVYLLVELNGPGMAVWDEIDATRRHINAGYQPKEMAERGLANVFFNVRNYLYSRPDSLSSGKALMWKTSLGSGPSSKVRVMERLRDFADNGMLKIRSMETLQEMRSVTREGDTIAAQGHNKDDRVMSLGLGVRCWEERVRRKMSVSLRTRERELARTRLTPDDKYKMFTSYQFQKFLGEKQVLRAREQRALAVARRRLR